MNNPLDSQREKHSLVAAAVCTGPLSSHRWVGMSGVHVSAKAEAQRLNSKPPTRPSKNHTLNGESLASHAPIALSLFLSPPFIVCEWGAPG